MIITMHSSYNDVVAVAALAVVMGFMAAVIAGDSSPTFAIAVIAFCSQAHSHSCGLAQVSNVSQRLALSSTRTMRPASLRTRLRVSFPRPCG